jgi:hypothetical protein
MVSNRNSVRVVRYADPAGINERWRFPPIKIRTAASESAAFIDEALSHNVLPSVARNLETAVTREPEMLVVGSGEAAAACRQQLVASARQAHLGLIARNMFLADFARDILAQVARDDVPAVLVKGLDFAENCYGGVPLRAFSDIDLLVRPDAVAAMTDMLVQRGLKPVAPTAKREDYTERQFVRDSGAMGTLLVELHTDLAHAPKLRRQTSLTYESYAGSAAGGVTMAARLVLAGIHGALSHLYERLQYVTDILAIVRRGVDTAELRERVDRTGSLLVVRTGLDLASRLFACPACKELCAALPPAQHGRLAACLVTPATVISAYGPMRSVHSWRRQAFRVLMTRQAEI